VRDAFSSSPLPSLPLGHCSKVSFTLSFHTLVVYSEPHFLFPFIVYLARTLGPVAGSSPPSGIRMFPSPRIRRFFSFFQSYNPALLCQKSVGSFTSFRKWPLHGAVGCLPLGRTVNNTFCVDYFSRLDRGPFFPGRVWLQEAPMAQEIRPPGSPQRYPWVSSALPDSYFPP